MFYYISGKLAHLETGVAVIDAGVVGGSADGQLIANAAGIQHGKGGAQEGNGPLNKIKHGGSLRLGLRRWLDMLDRLFQLDTIQIHIPTAAKADHAANATYAQNAKAARAAGVRLF